MKKKIKELLSSRKKRVIIDANLIRAGVLIPLYEKDGVCNMLFTKRTEMVDKHKGEVSFPGGAYEDRDGDIKSTALRETYEEIGVIPEDIEILGELDDFITTTGFIVSPLVGVISYPYEFKISQFEIEKLIEVPIISLVDENIISKDEIHYGGQTITSYVYKYEDYIIWGATARILKLFLDIIFNKI